MSDGLVEPQERAVEIPVSKVTVALLAALALLLTALSVVLVVVVPVFYIWIIGLAGALFFGFGAVGAAGRLLSTQPGLTIDAVGLIDRSSLICAGRVYWEEVMGIQPIRLQGQHMHVFVLRDHRAFCRRFRGIHRLLFAMNPWFIGGSFAIAPLMLGIESETLAALLMERFMRYQDESVE